MSDDDGTLHDLVSGDVQPSVRAGRSERHPEPPRVTPEPAPSDRVLLMLGVMAGVSATLGLLLVWWWWRKRD